VLFAVPCRGWEHKLAVRAMHVLAKLLDEFNRSRNLTIFPSIKGKSTRAPTYYRPLLRTRRIDP
jgi:hypothetical protein